MEERWSSAHATEPSMDASLRWSESSAPPACARACRSASDDGESETMTAAATEIRGTKIRVVVVIEKEGVPGTAQPPPSGSMFSSMLLRASRVAARAAVSAASRRAPVAGSGGAATAGLLLRRSLVASTPFGRRLFSHMAGRDPGMVEFVVDDKDMESDIALWNLYERWCKAWGQERSLEEMQRRFIHFKYTVFFVAHKNEKAIKEGRSTRFAVNMYADGKLTEEQQAEMDLDIQFDPCTLVGDEYVFPSEEEASEEEDSR